MSQSFHIINQYFMYTINQFFRITDECCTKNHSIFRCLEYPTLVTLGGHLERNTYTLIASYTLLSNYKGVVRKTRTLLALFSPNESIIFRPVRTVACQEALTAFFCFLRKLLKSIGFSCSWHRFSMPVVLKHCLWRCVFREHVKKESRTENPSCDRL